MGHSVRITVSTPQVLQKQLFQVQLGVSQPTPQHRPPPRLRRDSRHPRSAQTSLGTSSPGVPLAASLCPSKRPGAPRQAPARGARSSRPEPGEGSRAGSPAPRVPADGPPVRRGSSQPYLPAAGGQHTDPWRVGPSAQITGRRTTTPRMPGATSASVLSDFLFPKVPGKSRPLCNPAGALNGRGGAGGSSANQAARQSPR